MRAKHTAVSVVLGLGIAAFPAPAFGHGDLEILIGRKANNQLAFHAVPGLDDPILVPRSVFPNLSGFATPRIGFESLLEDVPAEGLVVLDSSAQISVRVVGYDPGVTIYNGFTALNVGDALTFGDLPFDNHPLFNIHASGAEPGQVFNVHLVLVDSSGQYSASDEFTVQVTPPCPADINLSDSVGVQDIFDFLGLYFQNLPGADFNGQNGVTVQDIFDFLAAFFEPCV